MLFYCGFKAVLGISRVVVGGSGAILDFSRWLQGGSRWF